MSLFPLDRFLARFISHGRLTVIGHDGITATFGEPGAEPSSTIRIHDPSFRWKVALRPGMTVGEAYMNGGASIEQGTLRDFLEIAMVSQMRAMPKGPLYRAARRFMALCHFGDMLNRIGVAERNVQHHYDIDHHLYESFLDEDLQYSCAYWAPGVTTLEEAQAAKKRHIAGKLMIEPGMEVLDIGSGWGGMALTLARDYGARVTGVTLSKDQFATAVRRAEEAGLADRVTFKLLDYRLETGRYDRIVSVGMFEHVGRPQFANYFRHVARLLDDGGIALIHTIGRMNDPGRASDWLGKYIFPGGYLPNLSELAPVVENQDLWIADVEVLRLHYAETLKAWNERFQAHRAEFAARFDERFCLMWEFYLQSCEASFRYQSSCVFQLQLSKRVDAVPITRDYLYAGKLRHMDDVEARHSEAAE